MCENEEGESYVALKWKCLSAATHAHQLLQRCDKRAHQAYYRLAYDIDPELMVPDTSPHISFPSCSENSLCDFQEITPDRLASAPTPFNTPDSQYVYTPSTDSSKSLDESTGDPNNNTPAIKKPPNDNNNNNNNDSWNLEVDKNLLFSVPSSSTSTPLPHKTELLAQPAGLPSTLLPASPAPLAPQFLRFRPGPPQNTRNLVGQSTVPKLPNTGISCEELASRLERVSGAELASGH